MRRRLLRASAIGVAGIVLGSLVVATAISLWTRDQLRSGPLEGVCIHDRHRPGFASGERSPIPVLARAALHRASGKRRWRTPEWQASYAAIGYLGFFLIPPGEQKRMLDRVPRCASGTG